ncbi:nuclear transport factor 2 family protein [Formosa sp. S-31]|uniref:nuclear transport factor 2 family protein n=1 Tax=Formosa sp. S-31 TaxID=2790949 RepID=UPI003EC03360
MIRILLLLALLITNSVKAQALDEKAAVKAAVDTFFDGFHKGDTTTMRTVLNSEVKLFTVFKNKASEDELVTGTVEDMLKGIAQKPAGQKWDERLLDYDIKIDGSMANVWTPYEFYYNDAFLHCGVNSFQLFKENDKWKIVFIMDTRRLTGCDNHQ